MRFVSLHSLLRASKARQRRSFSPLKNSCGSILKKKSSLFSRRCFRKRTKTGSSIRTRTKHTRHQSRDLFRMYRSMCVSFLCIHFYLHPERVKDGQFSNAFTLNLLVFFTQNLHSFRHIRADNTREIQHESRRKAGGNLHLRSAVVDLRVQLVGTFTFFLFICARSASCVALLLSLSLCVRVKCRGSRSLFSSEWDPNYIHDVVYFMLYASEHSRKFQLTPTNALPFSHSFVR